MQRIMARVELCDAAELTDGNPDALISHKSVPRPESGRRRNITSARSGAVVPEVGLIKCKKVHVGPATTKNNHKLGGKKMFGTSDTIQVTVLYPGSSYGAVAEFLLLRATESQATSTEHGRRSAESREPVVRNGLHCLKRAR